MIRLLVSLALATTLLASAPAMAAEHAAPKTSGIVNVELPPFFAPLVVDGRLQAYAYITVALTPASQAKVFDIRAKVPNLQDAFLREVNRGSIVKSGAKLDEPAAVDTEALKPRLEERMKAILPDGTVT